MATEYKDLSIIDQRVARTEAAKVLDIIKEYSE
jgi:hypothetical protein